MLCTANVVTLMMEALRSSETSVLTRAIQPNIPENGICHSHRHVNLTSYIYVQCFMLQEIPLFILVSDIKVSFRLLKCLQSMAQLM
jgi:hypothetical protein